MVNSVKWSMHRIPDEYNEDGSQKAVLTIITNDGSVINVPTTAHHYKDVLKSITDAEINGEELDEDRIRQFASITFSAGKQLQNLSPRVQFDGVDTILYDGDPIEGTIGEHLIALARAGKPVDSLVNFLDKVSQNPSENSRKQFYDFISRHNLTLTPEGDVIAYKGVKVDADGTPRSIHAGPGIVDGVTFTHDHLPNHKGAIVSIPRSYVDGNQEVGCSRGLHVGAFSYASSFAQGMTLTCKVNPRDVVSVPEDCQWQKIRVSRYEVIDSTVVEWSGPLYGSADSDGWDDEGDEDDYYGYEYLPNWTEAGINEDDAVEFIDEGYTLEEALEELEAENDVQVEGQTVIDFNLVADEDEDDEDTQVVSPAQVREWQDAIVEQEKVNTGKKVRRVKVKENSDGVLRRATLILKGDKADAKNRVHLHFNKKNPLRYETEEVTG